MATDQQRARVFAPATIGNVGPGFDVLGLCIDGLGDVVEARIGESYVEVAGRDAELVPLEPEKNAASIAARALLGCDVGISIHKGLPLSGGLGGSAASSVGGALAAALASGKRFSSERILQAALEGEAAGAGRHYDNLAPCLYGGLMLVLPRDPPVLVPVPVRARWWIAVCTPNQRLETKAARAVLPVNFPGWPAQMANTTALALAFSQGDPKLLRAALHDGFAEPARAPLDCGFCGGQASSARGRRARLLD